MVVVQYNAAWTTSVFPLPFCSAIFISDPHTSGDMKFLCELSNVGQEVGRGRWKEL